MRHQAILSSFKCRGVHLHKPRQYSLLHIQAIHMVQPIAPRLQTCTACYCTKYCRQLQHNAKYYNIIILWDHLCTCGPLLTEMSLGSAYRYRVIVLCNCWLPLPCSSLNIWELDLNTSVSCDGLSFHSIAWTFKLLAGQHMACQAPISQLPTLVA